MGGAWPLVLLLTQPGQLNRVMVSGGETFTESWSAKESETCSFLPEVFLQSLLDVFCHATASLLGATRWLGAARCYHLDAPLSNLFELDETQRGIRTGRLRVPRGTITVTYSAWTARLLHADLFGADEGRDKAADLLVLAEDLRTKLCKPGEPVAKLQFHSATVTVLDEYFVPVSLIRDIPMRFDTQDIVTQSLARLPGFCMYLFLVLSGENDTALLEEASIPLQLEDISHCEKKRRLAVSIDVGMQLR